MRNINKIQNSKFIPQKPCSIKQREELREGKAQKSFVLMFLGGDCPSTTEAHALLARL
jgi:hypothetical protein